MSLITTLQGAGNGLAYFLNLTGEPLSTMMLGLGVVTGVMIIVGAIIAKVKQKLQ